eukprot:scaffold163565_cov21-Tisochrysis_lutea.AAC.1
MGMLWWTAVGPQASGSPCYDHELARTVSVEEIVKQSKPPWVSAKFVTRLQRLGKGYGGVPNNSGCLRTGALTKQRLKIEAMQLCSDRQGVLEYNDVYFFTRPEYFIIDHIPWSSPYSLLDEPLTWKQ